MNSKFDFPANIISKSLLKFIKEADGQFVVPVYQREYKWSPTKSANVWWKDIQKLFENKDAYHFAGLVMYNISAESSNQTEVLIIDGQQRITTTFLLLKAISKILPTDESEEFRKNYLFIVRKGKQRLRLKELDFDNGCFKKIMTDQPLTDVDKKTNIYKVFKFFNEKITVYQTWDMDAFESVLNRLYVIDFPLKAEHEPQKIFESINSKGEKLTPVDLIRNFILMNLAYKEQERLWNTYWKEIQINVRAKDMENFILNFLRLKTQKYFNEPTMYEEFKSLYEFGSQTQEEFLKELLSYSILFKEIYYEYENKNVNLIDFSKFTSSRYCSSVSMELLKWKYDKIITDAEFNNIFKLFNNYLLRREICELQYDLAQVFVPLLSQMDEHKLKLHDFFLFKLVNENLDKPKRMPDDIELSSRIKETSAYKKGFTSVLFRNIEESSDNYKITKLSKGLTIEHIMPQNPEFNSSYFEEYKNNEELFDKYLNKIGNLTLLTRHENLLATCR